MSDLVHLAPSVRSHGRDTRDLIEIFVGMQVLAALIWTGFMTFRPVPDVQGPEMSVRAAVMEALAKHLTPVSTPVLVERPLPRKTDTPMLKPARKPSPAPAAGTWQPPPRLYAPPPPPAPRYHGPPTPARQPAAPADSATGKAWLSVPPPLGEH